MTRIAYDGQRTKRPALVGLAVSALALMLAGCTVPSGDPAPSSVDGAAATAQSSEKEEQSQDIVDGTYVVVNLTERKNEGAAVIVIDGDSVTQTFSDCWYGTIVTEGTRIGDEIAWDGETYPGEMLLRRDHDGAIGFDLVSTGSIPYLNEYFPTGTHGVDGDLAEFNDRCDFPISDV